MQITFVTSAQWKHLKSTWKVLEILSNFAKYLVQVQFINKKSTQVQVKYSSTCTSTHKIVLNYQST